VGEVSEKTGYQQAYVIKSGRTILDDGGGVCQVSTTIFRAALNTGLPIIERVAHAYRVAYYEQNSQVGLDATVYEPAVDLKFKNETPGYILIQSSVDQKNQMLIFDFYGTGDGRRVIIGKSTIAKQVPPPEPIHQEDPNLPKGEIKQIDWPAWGAEVSFSYQVTRGNELLQNETFVSRYRPWQAIYLVGTKEP
jgi:vancomycin resistance protein YoaR